MERHIPRARQTVTGSQHVVRVQGADYLLDCGQYQGRAQRGRRAQPQSALRGDFHRGGDALACAHRPQAAICHAGKRRLSRPIYASPATIDLCVPMLTDSAGIQEKDAAFLNKRRERRKALGIPHDAPPVQPLYTADDAAHTFPLFRPTPMHTRTDVGPGIAYETWDAGHILGSTWHRTDAGRRRPAGASGFSGDVGRAGFAHHQRSGSAAPMDYLIMESTTATVCTSPSKR